MISDVFLEFSRILKIKDEALPLLLLPNFLRKDVILDFFEMAIANFLLLLKNLLINRFQPFADLPQCPFVLAFFSFLSFPDQHQNERIRQIISFGHERADLFDLFSKQVKLHPKSFDE